MKLKKIITCLLLFSFFIAGCSSSMTIDSEPSGAKVYIDKEYKGLTPYTYTDSRPFWVDLDIVLKKDGYEDFNFIVSKVDGEFNYGAGCGSLACLPVFGVPFSLWLFKYPENKKFELIPE